MRHLRRLVPYLARRRRALLFGTLCLIVTTAFAAATPWVMRHAVDDLVGQLTRGKLYLYAGLVLALALCEGVFRYGMRTVLIGMSRHVEYELRRDVFAHLVRLPVGYYHGQRVGDVMSRATNDLSVVRMLVGPGIMYSLNTAARSLAAVALMAAISPRLLGLALLPLLLVALLVRHAGRRIHDASERVQAQLATLTALVQESLSGVRVVRAYVQEPYEIRRFDEASRGYLERNGTLIRLMATLYPGIQVLMGAGALLVLWLGGRQVVGGTITLGEFVAFGAYLGMLHWPMIALGWVVNLYERGAASMGRIGELLDAPVTIADKPAAAPVPVACGDGHADAADKPAGATAPRGAVAFRRLTFAYDGQRAVLHDIDFEVPAGSLVAVVGPTGSGKTTLVSLLPRLFDPPPGTLFVDGRDVRAWPLRVLRAAIAFVPQESFLFSASIRDNVLYGHAAADGARAEWAADLAQLAADVRDFPHGLDTLVGERGVTLSGGQRQRTALARALAADAPILVLDDALASVDTYTEERILRGLRGVMRGRTTFIVSHRVSTVKDADLILLLREGRIVERGRHAELLALGGAYAELYRRQLLEEEVQVA